MAEPTSQSAGIASSSRLPISAIVMTRDEERNLEACLQSIAGFVDEIFVVDSFSTDRTEQIARKYTPNFVQHGWENYARQFGWALSSLPLKNDWVLRIDADERWTTEGFAQVAELLKDDRLNGIYVRMRIFFMGRWIRHGDFYPNIFLRLFRRSKTSGIEQRWMDEHMKVEGKTVITDIDVMEMNFDRQENIALWTTKHNSYSTREAIDALLAKHSEQPESIGQVSGNQLERKRWLKENVYNALAPKFVRPMLYFLYRYIFRLGFLDGKEGFIFHLLQGFWYRFLVDVKTYQIEKRMRDKDQDLATAVFEAYGVKL